MKVTICIPTYNRARILPKAVEAALRQSYEKTQVVVIDDGSTDTTRDALRPFFGEPNFCYLKLADNVGTAQAKNVGLALADYDAISFHDSDDIPDRHKILLQVRALELDGHIADPILDWESLGITPGSDLKVDLVFTGHRLIRSDGSVHELNKRISVLDDFFPNLQFPAKTPGDWTLVNSALFRRSVFERVGGYLRSIEEDRELRNRVIATGHIGYFLDQPLIDKIEMGDSLTVAHATNYLAEHRKKDRAAVWKRQRLYRRLLWSEDKENIDWEKIVVPVDLREVRIEEISRPECLKPQDGIPCISALPELNGKPTVLVPAS
jgi:glycosyltransferase involved in cell wall biosynthesis